jgi:hypothetical protein
VKYQRIPAPLGNIEPHAPLLSIPHEDQLLFKIMTIEKLVCSIMGSYLHFNRVDSYVDFSEADLHDGQQLPEDMQNNRTARFEKAPEFSAADYYNQSRKRTYASCFSLENSDFIWNNYAKNTKKGKVCVVFHFGKLRAILNETMRPANAVLDRNGTRCFQIFSVNYGLVEYVDWNTHQLNQARLPNPIRYTYLKDKRFLDEKELRISLSAMGIGQYVLKNENALTFPPSLHAGFSFKRAFADGTIQEIRYAQNADHVFLQDELSKMGIVPADEISESEILPNKLMEQAPYSRGSS